MESLIKKYFWITNLLFIALAAWLLSNAINAVITIKMRSIPSMTQTAQKVRQTGGPKLLVDDNNVIIDRNYLGSAMARTAEGKDPAVDGSNVTKAVEGGESSLRATVVGTAPGC